jgi:hypothetical protein
VLPKDPQRRNLSIYLSILNPRSEWKRDKKERKKNLVLNEVQEM